ncbi:MAG: protein jag [Clostridiales bacterium]|nr:protein jag [Clostridiales bacterium]
MKTYESSAKTMEEAISAGLEVLGVSISDVTVDIIDEGSKGLFGLFGSRLAKVRLTVKEQEEDLLASLTEEKPAKKPAKKPAEKKTEPKQEKPKAPKQPKPKQEKPQTEKAEKPAAEKKPLPPKTPAKPLEKPVVTMLENDQVDADSAAGKAQAFLKELTHLMGVEVDVAVGNDAEGNVFVKMTGDTLGILIGRRGETLDALQYLTSLKINRGQEGYTRVTLDTENYRAKREDTLIRLANRMANRAVKTGRKVSLEPMNPYERRIIHSALQATEAVDTHSEGDEPNRHVVITLRK